MPVASPDQYRATLDASREDGHALVAVNVTSSETLSAAMRGFAEAEADGIVQLTVGGGAYMSGASVRRAAGGARALAALARELASGYPVLVGLHTDHCPPARVEDFLEPLLADSESRRGQGLEPLFNSHMFDGSSLPLEENLERSAELLDRCRRLGIVLEVECGAVGGEEDGLSGGELSPELYTTPEQLLRVASVLGTGERGRYLLAATFGNVHGRPRGGNVDLRPWILRDGQAALGEVAPGKRFEYVFHGSSGSSEREVREAVAHGVVKVNVDTDFQYAFTRAVADHVFRNYDQVLGLGSVPPRKDAFDPRVWGERAEAAMAAEVAATCDLVGAAGKTLCK